MACGMERVDNILLSSVSASETFIWFGIIESSASLSPHPFPDARLDCVIDCAVDPVQNG